MSNSKASVIVLSATAIHVVGIASAIYFHETDYDYLSMFGGFLFIFSIPLIMTDVATRKSVDRTALPIWIFTLFFMSTPTIFVYCVLHGFEAADK